MSKILKQKREELGEELRDISLVVRIRTTYLKAIEEEDFCKLPAEVYAKGYIREYARYLNVPLKDAVATYQQYLNTERQVEAPVVNDDLPEVSSRDNISPASTAIKAASFIPKIIIFVIAAALVFGIYVFVRDNWQTMGRDSVADAPKPMQPPVQQPAVQMPPAQEQPVQQANPQPQTPAANIPSAAVAAKPVEPAAQPRARHNLVINASEQVWIEINSDDKTKRDIIMNAGETQSFRANDIFRIKVGNAAGVKLSLNGKEMGPLGAKGEVVSLTLPAVKPQTQPVPGAAASGAPSQN